MNKKIFPEVLFVIAISLAAFATRVVNLLNIPIFTDEAIYIRWAQIGLADPAHRFISLTDGKQPLFTWLMYPLLEAFSDPLFAGRFVSVLSGVAASIAIYYLTKELFDSKTGVLTSILYIFFPFVHLYDRLALMDSLLSSLSIWSLYLLVLTAKRQRLDTSLLLGIVAGLALLTKSSAFLILYLFPISYLLFPFQKGERVKKTLLWAGLLFVAFVIAQVIYNSLRLSPWFYIIEQKNYSFIITFSDFFQNPFSLFVPNLVGLTTILFEYLTFPLSAFVLLGIFYTIYKRSREGLFLTLYFLLPFLSLAAFGKVIFPRFILFMTMPLLVLISWTVREFLRVLRKRGRYYPMLLFLILIYPIYNSYLILFSPVDLKIPLADRKQLFDDWPSGYGVREVVSFIDNKAQEGKVVLGTEGTFGLNPAVYEIYLKKNDNVEIYGFWPVFEVPEKLIQKAQHHPTYLVLKERQVVPDDWPLKLVFRRKRGKGESYLYFFQVLPHKSFDT